MRIYMNMQICNHSVKYCDLICQGGKMILIRSINCFTCPEVTWSFVFTNVSLYNPDILGMFIYLIQ